MEEYPSNRVTGADPSKPGQTKPDKKLTPVISKGAIRRKRPLWDRIAETIVGGSGQSVIDYIVLEVLVPAAKDMIADAANQTVERLLFGDTPRSVSRRAAVSRGSTQQNYTNYNRYSRPSSGGYGSRREDDRRELPRREAARDFEEIIVPSREIANEIIDRLFDIISKYEAASVADLYELVGFSSKSFVDDKWGWTDFRGAGATRVSNGYLLDLPKPQPLD